MSIGVLKSICVDFSDESLYQYITVFSEEIYSRTIEITPLNNGEEYIIPAETTARLEARKPDNNPILLDSKIDFTNNKIYIELTPKCLDTPGVTSCQIGLYGVDNRFIASSYFYIDVYRSALSGNGSVNHPGCNSNVVESSPEYQSFRVALLSVDEVQKRANAAILKAENDISNAIQNMDVEIDDAVNKVAESAEEAIENVKETNKSVSKNELERKENETQRQQNEQLRDAAEEDRKKDFEAMVTDFGNLGGIAVSKEEPESERVVAWIDPSDDEKTLFMTSDDIAQELGDSEEIVVSQRAVTAEFDSMIENKHPEYNNIIDWAKINHRKFHQGNSSDDNDGYWNTGYCKVEANTSYISFINTSEIYTPIVNFYNENKEFISYITNTKGFATPDNCAYVIMSFRYVHSGVMGTYTDVEGWDDYIGKIIVNVGTSGNITAPYDDYLANDIKIKRKVCIDGKVIYIEDGKRETATVNISRGTFSGDINICVCGSNIFDGITESGYYSGSDKLADADHKRSVNPIYVNENDYITFAKSCRVTEFDENGEYIISNLATARIPYKTAYKTSYVHIHGLIDDMDAMYVNIGKRLTDVAETYKCTTVTEAVRDWGTTIYGVEVPLYDGTNTVFVKSLIYENISLVYNPSTDNDRSMVEDLTEKVNNINYMRGVKIANSDRFVAHRGGSDFPENTYESYVSAFLNGFKAIESDVRFTSDNVPLMLHDATIDRTSNGTGAIADMTAEEVQSYDFGSWKHKKFTGSQIPTFKNFIRFCWQFDITPYIDIGGISEYMTAEQTQILYDIVAYYGLQEKAVWCCGNFTPVGHLNTIYNETDYYLNFAYITNETTPIDSVIDSLDWFRNTSTHRLGDVYVSMSYPTITAEYEQLIKSKNLKLTAYIVNDVTTARKLSGYRIDSIATDNLDLPIAICSNIAKVDWIE